MERTWPSASANAAVRSRVRQLVVAHLEQVDQAAPGLIEMLYLTGSQRIASASVNGWTRLRLRHDGVQFGHQLLDHRIVRVGASRLPYHCQMLGKSARSNPARHSDQPPPAAHALVEG